MTSPTQANPGVCVVIAAYNAQGTIARAIRSALAEPEVAEVIVVDDASTDNTVNSARDADDGSNRLKIIAQSANTGPSAARNRAIAESTSPWIAVLDADDFFLPGRIKSLLAFSDQADFIADERWQVAESDVDRVTPQTTSANPKPINFETFVLSNITRPRRDRDEMGFIKPLMRLQFMQENRLRYRETMRLGEDYEVYARGLGLGARFVIAPAKLYVSVMRPDSISGKHSEQDLLNLRECDNALLAELKLSPAEKKALRQHYLSIDCRLQWRLLITAVKNRNISAAITTFLRPYPVPLYLFRQLFLQTILRCSAANAANTTNL